jgi:hypothetical protein
MTSDFEDFLAGCRQIEFCKSATPRSVLMNIAREDRTKKDGRKTEQFREAARYRALAQWTPEAKARHSRLTREKMESAAVRERISNRTRAALADPDVHQRLVAGVREAMRQPGVVAKISENTRIGMARWRERRINELRRLWNKSDRKMRAEFLAQIGADWIRQ